MTVPRIISIADSRLSGSAPENEISRAYMAAPSCGVRAILRRSASQTQGREAAARAAKAGGGLSRTALADRQGQRLAVDVLIEPVCIRARVGLERRGSTALEDVEAVDVVRLPDVRTRPHVAVVRPSHVAEERRRSVEG